MPDTVYIEYTFKIRPWQPVCDILIAELGEVGFESFVEGENEILAYIQKKDWSHDILNGIGALSNPSWDISHEIKEIGQQNWNAVWEENFDPIQIEDQCVVRAPFHDAPKVRYDIVITPKMSFGTGHHETTQMMLRHILETDFKGKSVLDMGSGTGVLAILAALKGARTVDAIDIDHWCFLNAQENAVRNKCGHIAVREGDASLLKDQEYDLVLANINRNILLNDIPTYARCLTENGKLFLSGFYESDMELITEKCGEVGLVFDKKLRKNDWVSAAYRTSQT